MFGWCKIKRYCNAQNWQVQWGIRLFFRKGTPANVRRIAPHHSQEFAVFLSTVINMTTRSLRFSCRIVTWAHSDILRRFDYGAGGRGSGECAELLRRSSGRRPDSSACLKAALETKHFLQLFILQPQLTAFLASLNNNSRTTSPENIDATRVCICCPQDKWEHTRVMSLQKGVTARNLDPHKGEHNKTQYAHGIFPISVETPDKWVSRDLFTFSFCGVFRIHTCLAQTASVKNLQILTELYKLNRPHLSPSSSTQMHVERMLSLILCAADLALVQELSKHTC